jgi:hypothetical protein
VFAGPLSTSKAFFWLHRAEEVAAATVPLATSKNDHEAGSVSASCPNFPYELAIFFPPLRSSYTLSPQPRNWQHLRDSSVLGRSSNNYFLQLRGLVSAGPRECHRLPEQRAQCRRWLPARQNCPDVSAITLSKPILRAPHVKADLHTIIGLDFFLRWYPGATGTNISTRPRRSCGSIDRRHLL